MKNPFIKENNTALWIGAVVTGAVAAAAGIWFYLRGKRAAESRFRADQHCAYALAVHVMQRSYPGCNGCIA